MLIHSSIFLYIGTTTIWLIINQFLQLHTQRPRNQPQITQTVPVPIFDLAYLRLAETLSLLRAVLVTILSVFGTFVLFYRSTASPPIFFSSESALLFYMIADPEVYSLFGIIGALPIAGLG